MTKTIRLRYLAEVNPSTPEFDRVAPDSDVLFMPLETVWADSRLDVSVTRPKVEAATGYVRFRAGDILCPKVTPTFQAGRSAHIGALPYGLAAGAATTEVHVVRARARIAEARFLRYGLMSKHFLEEGVSRFQGVAGLQRVPDDFLRDLPLVHLPLEEQRRIADFLDDQVTRIDAAAELRAGSVQVLRERSKTELVSLLLPLAADRTVRVRSLIVDEVLGAWGEEPNGEGDLRVARVADFDRRSYTVPEIPTVRSLPSAQARRRLLQRGDVLLERSGGTPGRPVGAAAYFDDASQATMTSNFVSRLRPASGVDGRYLSLLLAAMYEARWNGAYYTQTTGIQNLDSHAYLRVSVPSRSFDEQLAIAVAVNRMLTATAAAEDAMTTARKLLEERKRALITAAVTGEFHVSTAGSRAAAAVMA